MGEKPTNLVEDDMRILAIAAIGMICSGCVLNFGNGMFTYDSADTRLGFSRSAVINADGSKESSTIFDTKGSAVAGLSQMSVRDLVIERIKKGETISQISKSLGLEADIVREWIK